MATKVSELSNVSSITSATELYVVQGGSSYKAPLGLLFGNVIQSTWKGNVALTSNQAVLAPGVIDSAYTVSKLTIDASGGNCTLEAGREGQLNMILTVAAGGGTMRVTGNNIAGNANIFFNKIGESAILYHTSNLWHVVGGSANIVIP